ncbi:MAG: MFS transporter [Alphaproteobacteria bacterium]
MPELKAEFGLGDARASLFTSSVQAGFVVGTIISALLTLADRINPRRLFMISALVAAVANGLIVVISVESDWVFLMRFVTGACMAGVYPVGMKIAAS